MDKKDIDRLRYNIIYICIKPRQNKRLSPCKDSTVQHCIHLNYQCFLWKHVLCVQSEIPSPSLRAWITTSGTVEPVLIPVWHSPWIQVQLLSTRNKLCPVRIMALTQSKHHHQLNTMVIQRRGPIMAVNINTVAKAKENQYSNLGGVSQRQYLLRSAETKPIQGVQRRMVLVVNCFVLLKKIICC